MDAYFSSKLSKSIESLTQSTDSLRLSKSSNAPSKTLGRTAIAAIAIDPPHPDRRCVPSRSPPLQGLLLKCKCRRFKMGKAESRYPSDVRFFDDRIEYCFVRESQFGKDHIAMVMYYRDMVAAKLSSQRGSFVYKIPRHLHHYFQDYEPENEHHVMVVKFDRQSEMDKFRDEVLPLIQGSIVQGT